MDEQNYFDEAIDIHQIFPRAWCERRGIDPSLYNLIVNKTALSSGTNRFLGGDAPSAYLRRLQDNQNMPPERLDGYVSTHLIVPVLLRADDLIGMMRARAQRLVDEIAEATGRPVSGSTTEDLFRIGRLVDDESEASAG